MQTRRRIDLACSLLGPFLTDHAKADVLGGRGALVAFAGGDVGAAAEGFAFAVVVGPFGDVAAEIEDGRLRIGATETADFLEQGRRAAEFLERLLQFGAIL